MSNHYLRGFQLIWAREWVIACASKVDWFNAIIFFVMGLCILPITLDVEKVNLEYLAPSMIWVMGLLSIMLSSDLWFKVDFEQGFLRQWFNSPYPIFLLVIAKILSHWMFVGGGILLATPIIAIMMGLTFGQWMLVAATLLMGTLCMCFVCALSASLTLGLRQAGVLLVILSLPLNVPVIIFGTGIVNQYMQDLSVTGGFLLLAGVTCVTVTIMPFAIAAALRISIE